jgi:hypothetical protein
MVEAETANRLRVVGAKESMKEAQAPRPEGTTKSWGSAVV